MSTATRTDPHELLPRVAPKQAQVEGPLCALTFQDSLNAPLYVVLRHAVTYMRQVPSDRVFDLFSNWADSTGWTVTLVLFADGEAA